MPNRHIKIFLDHYIDILEDPHYAILLKGNWGAGKTWFIKKYMSEKVFAHKADEEDKALPLGRFVHVSLFGAESPADIDAAIFEALHPVLGSKESALIAKLLRGAIQDKLRSNIIRDIDKKTTYKTRTADESFFNILRNTNKNVLVFDDIERCSMSGPELFGYINYFVEVLGYKVILMANEEEILAKYPAFKQVKEKLVGKTFEVQSEFAVALDCFLNGVFSPKAKRYLKKSRQSIEKIYIQSNINNLRVLKNSIQEFARLYQLLEKDVTRQEELMLRFLEIFLVLSFEILPGALQPNKIEIFFESLLFVPDNEESSEYNNERENMHHRIKKYASVNFHEICLGIPIWTNIFDKGSITKNQINAELKKSSYFDHKNKSPLEKLYNYPAYSDEEVEELLKQAFDEMPQKNYVTLSQLAHEAGTLFVLQKNGLLPPAYSVDKLMGIMGEKADHLFDNMSLNKIKSIFLGTDPEQVLLSRFMLDAEQTEYNRFIELVCQKQEDVLVRKMSENGADIFNDNLAISFDILNFISTSSTISSRIPFLSNLGKDLFVEQVIKLQGLSKTSLAQYIANRIEMLSKQPENPILAQEIDFLKDVLRDLVIKADQKYGKVSGVVLKKFINIIEVAIDKAEESIKEYQHKLTS